MKKKTFKDVLTKKRLDAYNKSANYGGSNKPLIVTPDGKQYAWEEGGEDYLFVSDKDGDTHEISYDDVFEIIDFNTKESKDRTVRQTVGALKKMIREEFMRVVIRRRKTF